MLIVFHCSQDIVNILAFASAQTPNSYCFLLLFICMKEASGTISGPGAFGKLKFESGIHRVQVQ